MSDYPDFTVIARLKGDYGGAEKAVALDVDGNLKTLLYGTYGGANKQILVDVDGNVRMNLYAQDLDEMVSRFKYGAPDYAFYVAAPAVGVWTDLIDLDGKGYIHLAHFRTRSVNIGGYGDFVGANLDGVFAFNQNYATLQYWGDLRVGDNIFHMTKYDTANFIYAATCLSGYTFESNCTLKYNAVFATAVFECRLFYQLI